MNGIATEARQARLRDFIALTKPRLLGLALAATAAGFWVGHRGSLDLARLLATLAGMALTTGGALALNMLIERDTDRAMRRTADRPLPAGRMAPRDALAFGGGILVAGTLWLAFRVSVAAAGLAAFAAATYLLVYTPLKRRTPLAVLAGAVPGALPPVVGWAAAGSGAPREAAFLFAFLFLWQLPHFLALAWLYRRDYADAGLPVWSVGDAVGRRTGVHLTVLACALIPTSLLAGVAGLAVPPYGLAASVLGALFVVTAAVFAVRPTREAARRVFIASVVYLPLVLLALSAARPSFPGGAP